MEESSKPIRRVAEELGDSENNLYTGSLLYSGSWDNTIKCWKDNKCIATLRGHNSSVRCLTIVGPLLYSGSYDGTIKCWQVPKRHEYEPYGANSDFIYHF